MATPSLLKYLFRNRKKEFQEEVLSAIGSLNKTDRTLLYRVFDVYGEPDPRNIIAALPRKEIAYMCGTHCVRVYSRRWKVLPTFRDLLVSVRKGN